MRPNSLLLDKFSTVKNHPMLIGREVYDVLGAEVHMNVLVKRVISKRRRRYKVRELTEANILEEARIIQSIGMLIALDKIGYYEGFVFKK